MDTQFRRQHTQKFREQVVCDYLDHPEMTYEALCEKYELDSISTAKYWVRQYCEKNYGIIGLIREVRLLKEELLSMKEDLAIMKAQLKKSS